jgi:hypothetical protein
MATNSKTLKAGQKVTFTGYSQLEPGQAELLTVGATYAVQTINADGSLIVIDERSGVGDTVFPEEISATVTKTRAAKSAATKAAKGGKKKATTKPTPAKTTAKPKKSTKKTKSETVEPVGGDGGTEAVTAITAQVSPLTDSDTVSKILETQDMLAAAKTLAVAAEETFISLGGVLKHIYDTGAHKQLGFDGKRGFADYMLKELNMQYRKGMYLIEIYAVSRRLNLDEALLAQIGWSKLKEISNKLDEANAAELLEYARSHTREELVAHVRQSYVNAGDGSESPGRVLKTRLMFNLFDDQYQSVERALSAASAQIDKPTPESALLLITAEWSQITESNTITVDEAVNALVLRFGAEGVRDALAKLDEAVEKNDQSVELETA